MSYHICLDILNTYKHFGFQILVFRMSLEVVANDQDFQANPYYIVKKTLIYCIIIAKMYVML